MEENKLKDKLQKVLIFVLVLGALLFIGLTFYHGFLKFAEILSLK